MSAASTRVTILVCGAIILSVFAIYGHAFDCSFINLDDDSHVRKNALILDGLTWTNVKAAFAAPHACLWIPFAWISFMTDITVFGLNPAAMHGINVAFHAANSVLLFLLLRRATGRLWPSAVVAGLFAVHPVNVESVVWITERKNVLCFFFGLLSLHAYTTYVRRNSTTAYFAAVTLFGGALLAKPMLVPLPAGLLLLDACPFHRIDLANWKRRLVEKVPFVILSVTSAAMTLIGSMSASRSVTLDDLSFGARISNALVSYVTYLRQLAWPADLSVLYPHKQLAEPVNATIAAILLLAITTAASYSRRKYPYLLVGWLWFLGMLVPTVGFVQVGPQSHADRFTYVAQLGIFTALSWLVADLWRNRPRRILGYAAAIVGTVLAMTTLKQVEYWTNSATLFEHAIAVSDSDPQLYGSAGFARAQLGDYPAAIGHYLNALRLNAGNAEDWNNLASAFIHTHRYADAQFAARTAVSLDPGSSEARFNLASSYELAGNDQQAINEFRQVIEADPMMSIAEYRLGKLLAKHGQVGDARIMLESTARMPPEDSRLKQQLDDPAAKQIQ